MLSIGASMKDGGDADISEPPHHAGFIPHLPSRHVAAAAARHTVSSPLSQTWPSRGHSARPTVDFGHGEPLHVHPWTGGSSSSSSPTSPAHRSERFGGRPTFYSSEGGPLPPPTPRLAPLTGGEDRVGRSSPGASNGSQLPAGWGLGRVSPPVNRQLSGSGVGRAGAPLPQQLGKLKQEPELLVSSTISEGNRFSALRKNAFFGYEAPASKAVLSTLQQHLPMAVECLLPPSATSSRPLTGGDELETEEDKFLGRLLLQAIMARYSSTEAAFKAHCEPGMAGMTRTSLLNCLKKLNVSGPLKRLRLSRLFDRLDVGRTGVLTLEAWQAYFGSFSEGAAQIPALSRRRGRQAFERDHGPSPSHDAAGLGVHGNLIMKSPVAEPVQHWDTFAGPQVKAPPREPSEGRQLRRPLGGLVTRQGSGAVQEPRESKEAKEPPVVFFHFLAVRPLSGDEQAANGRSGPLAPSAQGSRHVDFGKTEEREEAEEPPHWPNEARVGRRRATVALRDVLAAKLGSITGGCIAQTSLLEAAGILEELVGPDVDELLEQLDPHHTGRVTKEEWEQFFTSLLERLDLSGLPRLSRASDVQSEHSQQSREEQDEVEELRPPGRPAGAEAQSAGAEEASATPPARRPCLSEDSGAQSGRQSRLSHEDPAAKRALSKGPPGSDDQAAQLLPVPKTPPKTPRSRTSSKRSCLMKRKTTDSMQKHLLDEAEQELNDLDRLQADATQFRELVEGVEAELKRLLPDISKQYDVSNDEQGQAVAAAAKNLGYSSTAPRRNCIIVLREGEQFAQIRKDLSELPCGCSCRLKMLSEPLKVFVQELASQMGLLLMPAGCDHTAEKDEMDVVNLNGTIEAFTDNVRRMLMSLGPGAIFEFPSGISPPQKRVLSNIIQELGLVSVSGREARDGVLVGNLHEEKARIRKELLELAPGTSKVFTHLTLLEEQTVKMVAEELAFEVPVSKGLRRASTGARPVTVRRPRLPEPTKNEDPEGAPAEPEQQNQEQVEKQDSSSADSDTASDYVTLPEQSRVSHARVEEVFNRYADVNKSGTPIYLKKPGLVKFIKDAFKLQHERREELPRNPQAVQEELDAIFEDTVQLQLDMGLHQSTGLTLEFFQVFFSKAQQKLGWKLVRFLFQVLVKSGTSSATFGKFN